MRDSCGFQREFSRLFFRSILEKFQFSPLRDLEKNDRSGLIRLREEPDLDRSPDAKRRIETFEKAIIVYFRSRNEDNIKRPIPAINPLAKKSKSQVPTYETIHPNDTSSMPYRPTWATNINRSYQDRSSERRSNNPNTFPMDITNHSHYSAAHASSDRRRYLDGQIIYYDDGDGNDYPYAPGEISF